MRAFFESDSSRVMILILLIRKRSPFITHFAKVLPQFDRLFMKFRPKLVQELVALETIAVQI